MRAAKISLNVLEWLNVTYFLQVPLLADTVVIFDLIDLKFFKGGDVFFLKSYCPVTNLLTLKDVKVSLYVEKLSQI